MRRFHFFELFAVANLIAVALLFHRSMPIAGSPLVHFATLAPGLALWAICGVIIRSVVALVRRDRSYLHVIRDRAWLLETLRMVAGGALIIIAYGWVKLVVPIYHPRLFDQELWALDQALCFGVAPTTFVLELLRAPSFLAAIDRAYGLIFFTSLAVAYGYFLSSPDRRTRVAFANGNALLWMIGGWLYLAIPSLGPAFRFPEVWLAHAESLRSTQAVQAILMRNYQNVIRAAAGEPISAPIRIVFGIGAFPSLHVGFQTYVFFWMRRLWTSGEVLFGLFAATIFLGSMITGWHYFVDGLAGVLLAYLAYRFCFPTHARDSATDDPRRGPFEADDRGGAV